MTGLVKDYIHTQLIISNEELIELVGEDSLISPIDWDLMWEDFSNYSDASLDDYDSIEDACIENNLDYYYKDPLEFWVVSPAFEMFCESKGSDNEMFFELFGMTIWGRTTSGQSIALDCMFQ